jgi:hypothetical protein
MVKCDSETCILHGKRFVFDFIITFLFICILYILGLLILGFDLLQQIVPDSLQKIASNSLLLALIIVSVHLLLCLHDEAFFRKYTFLLPEDITYYIFLRNKSGVVLTDKTLVIGTPANSKHILSDPKLEEGCLSYRIDKLKKGETKVIFLLLHTNKIDLIKNWGHDGNSWERERKRSEENRKIERKLEIPYKKFNMELDMWWSSPDNIFADASILRNAYLLLTKNVILLLFRFLISILLFFCVLALNPPPIIDVDSQQIYDNLTTNQEDTIIISINNLGCDLHNLAAKNSEKENASPIAIEKRWTSNSINLDSNFPESIRLNIKSSDAGVYSGFISITANGSRRFTMIKSLNETAKKTLSIIPYHIQIKENKTDDIKNFYKKKSNLSHVRSPSLLRTSANG